MKKRHLCLIVLITIFPGFTQLTANPFACRLQKQKTHKPGKHNTALVFVGYAKMENQQFAVIQLKNNQYILKSGESIGGIRVIRFTSESLVYRENNAIFNIPLHRHPF